MKTVAETAISLRKICSFAGAVRTKTLKPTGLDWVVQQQPIATAHHPDPVCDKTTCLVLARINLEIFLVTAESQQTLSDGSIAFAVQPCIQRSQRQKVPLSQLCRHGAEIRPRQTATKAAPKLTCGMDAKVHELVHGQGCGVEGGGVHHCLGQPELMFDAIDAPDCVPAIRRTTQIDAVEKRQRDRLCRCGTAFVSRRQNDGLRPDVGRPEWCAGVRRCVGIVREIATPSGGRKPPARRQKDRAGEQSS